MLNKALHGLKQGLQAWRASMDSYFHENGFTKCPYEHAVYMKKNKNGEILIICIYVDDLLFARIVKKYFKNSIKLCPTIWKDTVDLWEQNACCNRTVIIKRSWWNAWLLNALQEFSQELPIFNNHNTWH